MGERFLAETIVDTRMPEIDGFELDQEARRS